MQIAHPYSHHHNKISMNNKCQECILQCRNSIRNIDSHFLLLKVSGDVRELKRNVSLQSIPSIILIILLLLIFTIMIMIVNEPFIQNDMILRSFFSFLFFLMLGLSRVGRARDKGKFKFIHFQFHLY